LQCLLGLFIALTIPSLQIPLSPGHFLGRRYNGDRLFGNEGYCRADISAAKKIGRDDEEWEIRSRIVISALADEVGNGLVPFRAARQ
jgi:hypothetical protein